MVLQLLSKYLTNRFSYQRINKKKKKFSQFFIKESFTCSLILFLFHLQCIAMDCEMVGVGETGSDSILARISLVNQFGKCVYDKFVKPTEEVVDYRTWVRCVATLGTSLN